MLSKMPFSAEVLLQHKQLVSLINGLLTTVNEEVETTQGTTKTASDRASVAEESESKGDTMAVDRGSENAAASSQHQTVPANRSERLTLAASDQCDFCDAPIPFTDLATATCTNGHQFPRCGISFLAIQAPGITKSCGICSTPFLSEEFVEVQEVHEGAAQPPVTLSRVLFQACDVCIYCGGKFVG